MFGVTETLLTWLAGIPGPIVVMIMAALPITELRAALPVGYTVYNMSIIEAYIWSVIGNMLPIYFLLLLFEQVSSWLRKRSDLADRFFTKLFERTRIKLAANIDKYGHWALTLFVAVPLPVTGAWTGALAAFVFGIPKTKAFLAILVGAMVAGLIVTVLTLFATATVRALLL